MTTQTTTFVPIDDAVNALIKKPAFMKALALHLEISEGEEMSEFVAYCMQSACTDFHKAAKLNRANSLEAHAARLRKEAQ